MAKIFVKYLPATDTFLATDESGNSVSFKENRLVEGDIEVGQSLTLSPMQALLMASAGCSGIDVVMILKKQRIDIASFEIEIDAERQSGVTPAVWENIHYVYHFDAGIPRDKAERAVQLSVEKYCSVMETLRRAGASIQYEVKVD